ncbi:MAG: recombination mediator protein UvsY [bacterium]
MTNEKFQELKKLIEKEIKLDESNIMEKSIQLSNLHTKMLQLYSNELKLLKNKYHEREKIFGELYEHFRFKSDYSLTTKTEIEPFIKSNDKYYKAALEYSQQEVIVKYIEQTIDQINALGFRIKNYIDLLKIKKGIL